MQYTKPLNETNLNAGYRDAVPAQGIKGSTVPALAIEAPQREIVNAIISAGLTPSAEDNTQLTQAIEAKISEAAAGKQDALVSGTNIKTLNGSSLLGSGDIQIGGANSSLSNLTNTGIGNVRKWTMPNYNSSSVIATNANWEVQFPYTVTADGFISIQPGSNSYVDLVINGGLHAGANLLYQTIYVPVKKGDIITRSASGGTWTVYFVNYRS